MIEATPDFVAVSTLAGEIVYINEAGRRMVGIPADADLSLYSQRSLTPDWAAERTIEEWLPAALRDGSVTGEGGLKTTDGREIPVSFVMVIHRDASGEPEYISTIARDISERMTAEEALRESEGRFRAVTRAGNVVVYTTDRDLRYSWIGSLPGFIDRSEVLGRRDDEILPADVAAPLVEAKRSVIETGVGTRIEFRTSIDGSGVLWYDVTLEPLRDASGEVTGVAVAAIDITERKLAQEELLYQLNLTQSVMDSAALSIFVSDRDGGIAFANAEAEKTFGFTLDELRGRRLHDVIHHSYPDGRPFPRGECPLGAVNGDDASVRNYEGTFWRKDGTPIEILCSKIVIRDAEDRVSGEVMAILDISGRKAAETASAQLAAIVASSADAIYTYSFDGTIQSWNAGAENLFGYKADETIGRNIEAIIPADRMDELHETILPAVAAGRSILHFETKRARRDGSVFDALLTVSPIRDAEGRPVMVSVIASDITERKSAERALRESEERFRSLVSVLTDVPWSTDASGAFVEYQAAWAAYTGQTWEEMRGFGWADALHPDDRDEVKTIWQRSISTGADYESRGRVWHAASGEYRYFVARAAAIFTTDEHGRRIVREWVGSVTDVHERRKFEERIEAANLRFQIAEEAVKGFSYEWNVKTGKVLRTVGVELVTGYRREEIDTSWSAWAQLIHPDDRAVASEAEAIELAGRVTGTTFDREYRVRHKNGEWIWVQERALVVRDQAGEVIRVVGQTTDVSDRKRTEIELAAQRRLYQSITDNATTALFIMDEHQHCAFMNPAAEKLTGYSFEETRGRALHEVVHHTRPDGRPYPLSECPIDQAFPTRAKMQGEEIFVHKDGSFYPVAFTASPLVDEAGKTVGTVIEVQDIRERRSIEEERRNILAREHAARVAAEEANRAKDDFLAVLSHELRTPLNSMFGWTQILLNSRVDESTVRKGLEVIARNVRLQNALIEDLLDVSRIITGKLRLEKENLSFSSIVHSTVESSRPTAAAQGVRLDAVVDNFSGEMFGDRHRLQQAVGNLLTNAIKFTPAGGRVDVSLQRHGSLARLTVSDTGIGIEPDLLPEIFDRFRQADGSYKRKYGGLGLGLTIVRNIVELHGGTVTAYSEGPDRGATFTVELPLVPEPVSFAGLPSGAHDLDNFSQRQALPLDGLRILIVDDDPDALDLMRVVMEANGATTTACTSAATALERLASSSFDLIISDIGMADTDGLDLIRAVRTREKRLGGRRTAAIALSGFVSPTDRELALTAGFEIHLPKPVDLENLKAVIMSMFDKRA